MAAEKLTLTFNLNGGEVKATAYPLARLLDVLREELHLTGTKEGCGEGECGACSVMMDGRLVNACLVPFVQADGADVTTVEGLACGDELHPVQAAFLNGGGAQCGICTPGMIMATCALLAEAPEPSDAEVRTGLAGNLCRCTGYTKIFDSVHAAAEALAAARKNAALAAGRSGGSDA